MIILTRLDGTKILINTENVKYIECTPDTLITFVNGDSLFVKETFEDLIQSVVSFNRKVFDPFLNHPKKIHPSS